MNYYPMTTIPLDHFNLRMIKLEDAPGIFAIRNDLKMITYSDIPQMQTIEEAKKIIQDKINGIKENKWLYWIIANKETDALMGTICLFHINNEEKSCDIGYELLPDYQGNGYIADAMKPIMNFAFKKLYIDAIFADIHKENSASINVIQRAGFKFIKDIDDCYKLYCTTK